MFLSEAIQSVVDQSYPKKEIIIVDGGSTDGTLSIIQHHEKNLAAWVSEPDAGQADAINKGLAMATGEIVNWLNADDVLLPNALRRVATYFEASPMLEVLNGFCLVQDTNKRGHTTQTRTELRGNVAENIVWCSMGQPAQFYRKTVFNDLGVLRTDLLYAFDKEFWRRYLVNKGSARARCISESLAVFRVHAASKTTLFPDKFKEEECLLEEEMLQNNGDSRSSDSGSNPTQRDVKGLIYVKRMMESYADFRYAEARKNGKLAIRHGAFFHPVAIRLLPRIFLLPDFFISFLRKLKHEPGNKPLD